MPINNRIPLILAPEPSADLSNPGFLPDDPKRVICPTPSTEEDEDGQNLRTGHSVAFCYTSGCDFDGFSPSLTP